MKNPLLQDSALPFEAIPFDQIRMENFPPAFEESLKAARVTLAAVSTSGQKPDFANVIEAIEFGSERLDHVALLFSNLLSANTEDAMQEYAKEILPKLAAFSNDLFLDEKIFAKVKKVHERSSELRLNPEQARLLEKTYRAFVRNGALLSPEGKTRVREIDQRLAVLGQEFSDHVLKATNEYEMLLQDRADLAGLPASVVEASELAAKAKSKSGWLFTLQYPSLLPFLKFSERRELRERLWRASATRATAGETDNRPIILEIVHLRKERARLLSFETHAHFVLEERMASNPETVHSFLQRIFSVSKEAALRELDEVRAFSGLGDSLRPWDFMFWSERLKKRKFDFDEERLRPYFKLENVIEGVFEHARRLYGLKFHPRPDLPIYHPDVQVFEVQQEKTGEFIGLFYGDFFPRDSKRGGAWMTQYREQGISAGRLRRPQVSIVCNLTKPTESAPSLLDLNEVRTIFHEFGHALHGLLSQVTYRSLAGPNVYWDFVELPSQIMENWVKEKESLSLFARHYQTGETIPDAWIDKIRESVRFQAGWFSLRQYSFAILDMAWHSDHLPDLKISDEVEIFEQKVLQESTFFPPVPGAVHSCSFSHIFAGGYSAGYYSYKWAEVLDADAFEFFQERGIFSREVADRFQNHILSRGGTEHPMELYRRFRGRDPDADALLRREGLLDAPS